MEFSNNNPNRSFILTPQSYPSRRFYQASLNNNRRGALAHRRLNQSANIRRNFAINSPQYSAIPTYGNPNLGRSQIIPGTNTFNQNYNPYQSRTITYPQKRVNSLPEIKPTYSVPTIQPVQTLPTNYLQSSVITSTPQYNIRSYSQVTPTTRPYLTTTNSNLATNTYVNMSMVQQPTSYYTPITNISYSTPQYETNNYHYKFQKI